MYLKYYYWSNLRVTKSSTRFLKSSAVSLKNSKHKDDMIIDFQNELKDLTMQNLMMANVREMIP